MTNKHFLAGITPVTEALIQCRNEVGLDPAPVPACTLNDLNTTEYALLVTCAGWAAAARNWLCDIATNFSPGFLDVLAHGWAANTTTMEIVNQTISIATIPGSAAHMCVDVALMVSDEVQWKWPKSGTLLSGVAAFGLGLLTLDEISPKSGLSKNSDDEIFCVLHSYAEPSVSRNF